jgi:tetratricopeptide (TPR) repeat protein
MVDDQKRRRYNLVAAVSPAPRCPCWLNLASKPIPNKNLPSGKKAGRGKSMLRVSLALVLSFVLSCQGQPSDWYLKDAAVRESKADFDGALADYEAIIKRDPTNAQAYAGRAGIRNLKGDHPGALKDYDSALSLNPALTTVYRDRGLVRQTQGDAEGAVADFTTALELDPNFGECYYDRANVLTSRAELERALSDYDKAIAAPRNPYLSESYNGRGVVRKKMNDVSGAIGDFTKVIEIDSNYLPAYANRGIALILIGKDSEAQKDFDYLLRVSPSLKSGIDQTITNAKKERAETRHSSK